MISNAYGHKVELVSRGEKRLTGGMKKETHTSTTTGLPYSPGAVLSDTQDHLRKLAHAWRHIRRRREEGLALYNLSGLERGLRTPETLDDWVLDDEWSGALYSPRIRALGLDHLGGDPDSHDIVVTNRLTAALYAAFQVTVEPGSTVIGVSPSYSHPAVVRGVRDAGGRLIETVGVEEFERELERRDDVTVVVVTRLAVTYDALSTTDLERIVQRAHEAGAVVVADDAGGARVGPAILDQPRTLALGVDLGATGLDKYGVCGPRVGLLGGRSDLVAAARARAFELGSECRPVLYPAVEKCLSGYRPQRVRDLVDSTRVVGRRLLERLGDWVEETPFITRLPGDRILARMRDQNPDIQPDLAPIEATALVAMNMLADNGFLTVHFAGLPPGTDALLIKFLPPETIAEIGGADVFAEAVDTAVTRASRQAVSREAVQEVLFGP